RAGRARSAPAQICHPSHDRVRHACRDRVLRPDRLRTDSPRSRGDRRRPVEPSGIGSAPRGVRAAARDGHRSPARADPGWVDPALPRVEGLNVSKVLKFESSKVQDPHDAVLAKVSAALARATDAVGAMERVVAVLKQELPYYSWVGIYLVDGDELVLGPFLGKPSPHTRIPLGKGICGAAVTEKATIIVDDVNADPRYLACSLETKSEIVVPIMNGTDVLGEIDIDSDQPAAFGPADRALLEQVAALLSEALSDS